MKKALLVLGFAMCATFAFAQTSRFALPEANCKVTTVELPKAAPVDYKASIFTKEDVVLQQFNFAADNMTGIVYGANGQITNSNKIMWSYDSLGNLSVVDTLVVHGQNASYSNWQRISDTGAVRSNYSILNNTWMLNYIPTYMGPDYTGDNNGFMLMTLRATYGSGVHNAFFQLPEVNPQGSAVIDVAFNQLYRKYYDQCFIDYKIGDKWVAREVNTTGIDLEVNDFGSLSAVFTMPLALANESMINIRIRYYSPGRDGTASYGYVWAIDNVTIIGGSADRWYTKGQSYRDGAYGTLPEGMDIPLAWFGNYYNNGANARPATQLTMEHLAADRSTSTVLITENYGTIAADPTTRNVAVIDERGLLEGEGWSTPEDLDYAGWWWNAPNYQATTLTGNYAERHLPNTAEGLNFVTANVTSTGADAAEWDTIAYNVVGETGGEGGLAIEGKRWGHDNGIIPSNTIYSYGYVYEEPNWYITEDGNYDHEGYTVWVRYTTGNDIPEGWVFRGMEIIPNTINSIDEIASSEILPTVRIAGPSDQGANYVSFEDLETGASTTVPYVVSPNDVNILPTGYINTNDPNQSYNAVNLRFYAQPELQPNTSYYFGYQMAANGKFAACATSPSYYTNEGRWSSYLNDPDIAHYYDQFEPGTYDVFCYDPDRGQTIWASAYYAYFPMIRPIIGAPEELPTWNIYGECGNGISIESEAGDDICGGSVVTYEGSGSSVYVVPLGGYEDTATGCYIVNTISIDNNVIDIENPPAGVDVTEANYIVYNADSTVILQRRFYYAIAFTNISESHVVSATATWDVFHPENVGPGPESIDVASALISLGLQPNPATSNVKLNIQGVEGTVNCSIIDMNGRVVYSADVNAGQPYTIDLSGVAAGAYFVRVVTDNACKVEKLIVR